MRSPMRKRCDQSKPGKQRAIDPRKLGRTSLLQIMVSSARGQKAKAARVAQRPASLAFPIFSICTRPCFICVVSRSGIAAFTASSFTPLPPLILLPSLWSAAKSLSARRQLQRDKKSICSLTGSAKRFTATPEIPARHNLGFRTIAIEFCFASKPGFLSALFFAELRSVRFDSPKS